MESVGKRRKISPKKRGIMDLPDEILQNIFLKVSQYDVQRNLVLVCRRFKDITRNPVFAQDVKIESVLKERPFWAEPVFEFPFCSIRKMEQVREIYPNSTFELKCTSIFKPHDHKPLLIGYSWMKEFSRFANSIKKFTLALKHKSIDYTEIPRFENLDCLEIKIFSKGIEDFNAKFWSRFPNLKSLKIVSHYSGHQSGGSCVSNMCLIHKVNISKFNFVADC